MVEDMTICNLSPATSDLTSTRFEVQPAFWSLARSARPGRADGGERPTEAGRVMDAILLLGLAAYFLPTIVAAWRGRYSTAAIFHRQPSGAPQVRHAA